MKLSEYFSTPRGYKRLAIVPAVAIIAALAAWVVPFFAVGVCDKSPLTGWILIALPIVYVLLLVIDIIVKHRNKQVRNHFPWVCAGIFIVIYWIVTFCMMFSISQYGKSSIGVVTDKGLYNSIGISKVEWNGQCMFIAEYDNKYTNEHCYLVLHNNTESLSTPGILVADIYDMNLHRIDGFTLEAILPGEDTMTLGEYIDDYVGEMVDYVFLLANDKELDALINYYKENNDILSTPYRFFTRDMLSLEPMATPYPDAKSLGWWHKSIYNEKNNLVAVSFMKLPVKVVNNPAYSEK